MFEKQQKNLKNVYLFLALMGMEKKIGTDLDAEKRKQNKNIQKLMKAAWKHPFYKKRFKKAGVRPSDIKTAEDLAKLPLLTKDEVRAWMNKEAEKPGREYWYADTTSGSSGKPLMILLSPWEKACMLANWYRVLMKAGYNPLFGRMMTRVNAHDEHHGQYDTILQRFGLMRRSYVNQFEPEPDVIRAINKAKPDLLYMNKTEFMRIALYAQKNGVKVWHPKFYIPISEKTDDAARKLFKEVLGPNLVDSYGSAETGACMLRLPDSDEYVVHNDSFVVNIIDAEGKLANEGRVVVTPLFKTDLPLINYVIGDEATSRVEKGIRFVTGIKGRSNDFFKYRTGEVTTFFEITPVIAHSHDIQQIRFVQNDYDTIHVQIVQDTVNSKKSTDEIEKELTQQFNEVMKHPMHFEFEWMNSIPPDPNGKLRMIVCNIKEETK